MRETSLMHQYHADSHIYALGPHTQVTQRTNQYFDMYLDVHYYYYCTMLVSRRRQEGTSAQCNVENETGQLRSRASAPAGQLGSHDHSVAVAYASSHQEDIHSDVRP